MVGGSSADDVPHFVAPAIQENNVGWGPCEMPDQFQDIPYQPFSKGDRLGKISDWTGAAFQDKKYASTSVPRINIIFFWDAPYWCHKQTESQGFPMS